MRRWLPFKNPGRGRSMGDCSPPPWRITNGRK
ncbi:hypothetical protein TGAMA5MH_10913 [Trichoderma gamsii]|uniref:Uncharacterized protein n=1 Tax=Trichoderma gamsii TaxID=398673 RepID=A0A2K0SVA7_9HYPO|nr:hypothetical protein TGAMA5MH_10913 [Trichoderma gamsii]